MPRRRPPRRDSLVVRDRKLYQTIVDALRSGLYTQRTLAAATGVSCATICRIGRSEGIGRPTADQRVTAALEGSAWRKQALIRQNDALFAKIERALAAVESPAELEYVARAYAIALDKRLLLEGAATNRTEAVSQPNTASSATLERKLERLAARREQC